MNAEDMKLLLRKVEELKALLVFTERTIPFLEDVIGFVQEIVPMVEDLKSSVESSSEKLPKASSQLANVSTATEMATTEILNIVERMSSNVDRIRIEMENDQKRLESLHLEGVPAGRSAAVNLVSIQDDCTNIMIALQVQDITAQQIAAVNKLMQSVDGGLSRLLRHFTKVTTEQDDSKFRHRRLDIVFDASAEYSGGSERQRVADEVVESARRSGGHSKTKRNKKKSPSRK